MKKPKQWNNDIYANIVMKKKTKQKMTKETQKHVNWEWSHDTNANSNMQKENIRQNYDKGDTKANNLATQEQWWKQKQTIQEKKIQNPKQESMRIILVIYLGKRSILKPFKDFWRLPSNLPTSWLTFQILKRFANRPLSLHSTWWMMSQWEWTLNNTFKIFRNGESVHGLI